MTSHSTPINRRTLVHLGLGGSLAGALPASAATQPEPAAFNPSTPQEHLDAYVKMLGSTRDETVYASFSGILWGAMANAAPVQLCGFHGIGRFDWRARKDGSYYRRSFDIGMFSDLETGAALEELYNPFTDKTVLPHHFKYGGGEELFTTTGKRPPNRPAPAEAKPVTYDWDVQGDNVILNNAQSGAVPHPLSKDEWPLASTGEDYFYGSENTYISPAAQLTDPNTTRADYTLFWSSLNSWEAWLLMGETPGFVLWRATGRKLARPDDAPQGLLEHIEKVQPNYFDTKAPWEGRESSFQSFKETRTPSGG